MKAQDLTGQTFGRLTVLKPEEGGKWLCRCECGTEVIITGRNLRRGATKSCGCLRREVSAQSAKALTASKTEDRQQRVLEAAELLRNRLERAACYNCGHPSSLEGCKTCTWLDSRWTLSEETAMELAEKIVN